MPTTSTGCATCRRRKIRCDEARPGCRRCATHGVACPGYRQDRLPGSEFEDETARTALRARERYERLRGEGTGGATATAALAVRARSMGSSSSSSSSSSPSPSSSSSALSSSTGMQSPEGQDQARAREWSNATQARSGADPAEEPSRPPTPLLSPPTMRSALYSTFLTLYLPQDIRLDPYSFYSILASASLSHTALLHSMDTLSLVVLGCAHHDQTLIKQAQRSYGQALKALMRALADPDSAYRDDQLLATISVLQACGFYDAISTEGTGWMSHVQGSQQLIAARGPESLRSRLALLVYSNAKHGLLAQGLISRKATFIAGPEWRAVAFRAPIVDASTRFYDVGILIPGLLERRDRLQEGERGYRQSLDNLIADCVAVQHRMRRWYHEYELWAQEEDITLFTLEPIDEFPTFTSLCSDRAFDQAFMFGHFGIAYLLSVYWTSLYSLQSCIASLHGMRSRLRPQWNPDPKVAVGEVELLRVVDCMCRSMPFFSEPMASTSGQVGMFLPLREAATYYVSRRHWRKAGWVKNVMESVFVKGMSPPLVTPEARAAAARSKRGSS